MEDSRMRAPVPRNLPWRSILQGVLFLALFLIVARQCSWIDEGNPISYTEFRRQLQQGNVLRVTVSGDKITGRFKRPVEREAPPEDSNSSVKTPDGGRKAPARAPSSPDFVTYLPSFGDQTLFPLIQEKSVEVLTRPLKDGMGNWTGFLLLMLLFGIGMMILQRFRMQGSGMLSTVDQSQARLYDRRARRTLFSDIAGMQAAKRELEEIVEFLKNPQKFQRLGGKMPRGVLLVGPPGTGKTLLARAVAGEADVPFLSISGSDFMELFVGIGASRVRSLFRDAKRMAPSIIFIDEVDSIGTQRGVSFAGGRDERQQTLNQLLSEMDGFEPKDNVIVMAATNRPDVLDPALLRPGRFDRHVAVDLPSLDDRIGILKIHARNKPLDATANLMEIARGTPGFSGADLENLLNEAAIIAARKGKDAVGDDDIQDARDKVIMGLERTNLQIGDEERKLLAYHEGGHTVVAVYVPFADPVYKVSIIPRGHAMGVTQQLPEAEKYIYSQEIIRDRLAVMLGGRAAEMLVFGTCTTGAEQDLKQAIGLARKMILDWGMGDQIPHLALGGQREQYLEGLVQKHDYSERMAETIDQEVSKIIHDAFTRATEVLKTHRNGLDLLVKRLIEREEVSGREVKQLLKSVEEKAAEGTSPQDHATS
jgi:cell division protease FtsH